MSIGSPPFPAAADTDAFHPFLHGSLLNHALDTKLRQSYAESMPTPAVPGSRSQPSPGLPCSAPPEETGWEGHAKGSAAYGKILAGLAFAGVATFAQLYSTQAVLPLM